MPAPKVPQVWRLKLNTKGGEVTDPRQIFDFCRQTMIIGLGWGVPHLLDETDDFNEYRKCADRVVYENSSFDDRGNIRRLALEMQEGDLCWIRSPENIYFLTRIEGPWRYRSNEDTHRYDLYNHRRAVFQEVGNASTVPGRVVASFSGQGMALQRINDRASSILSRAIWNELSGQNVYAIDDKDPDFFAMLSPDELEELILLWMQLDGGYVIFAGSRKGNTLRYEWVAKRKDDPRRDFVVQVKSGLSRADQAALQQAGTPVVFDNSEQTGEGVVRVTKDQLTSCIRKHFPLFPKNLQRRAKIAGIAP